MRTIRSVQGLGFLAVAFALLVAPAASGEVGRVTGVTGSVSTGGREVANLSGVAQDEKIETGDDGNVAMLLGNDVLVELCSRSSAVVEEDEGRRIVRLESGEARIVVEPGRRDVPIEIHTPAAIATILGTVVYVSVDPTTGATTVTSSDHDVQVIGIGPAATAPVKIKGGERTTVSWGSEPAKPQKLGFTSMRNLGSCLGDFDRRLRTISVIRARAAAHLVGGHVHGLQPAGAKSVDRHAGHAFVQVRGQHGGARQTGALLADLGDIAPDHVLDAAPVQPVAGVQRVQHVRGQLGGGDFVQAAILAPLATGAADGVVDIGVLHGGVLSSGPIRGVARHQVIGVLPAI